MPEALVDRILLCCSFCAKDQDAVSRLLAGPNGVYICDECVAACNEILEEHKETDGS